MTLSALTTWVGGFVLFYGLKTFRNAAFPICFLFFMVPIPALFLDQIVVFLQKGSTEVTDWAFRITGVPVERDGFVFSLSKIEFEVAKDCSGMRGSLYLFMTSLVFGQVFLKRPIARAILALSALPIAFFRTGLRIFSIGLLGNYVHEAVLFHHRRSGILTSVLGVIVLAFVTRWLRRPEGHGVAAEIRN
jgi:exosortase